MGRVNVKTKNQERLEKLMLFGFLLLAIITTIGCCYGYAAFESDLQVSGEGMVRPPANFTSTYMQDVTPNECASVDLGQTKQLIDKRDGKSYWVAKLKDGNCWMTQNLDYDLIAGTILTPADTDVTSNYKVKTTVERAVPAVISGNDLQASFFTERSWDMGEHVLATPLKGVSCNNPVVSEESPNTSGANSLRYGDTFDRCSDFQKVAGWQPTYTARLGTWKGTPAGNGGNASAEGLVTADLDAKTYDAHYLVGNYYQYNTATLNSAPASVTTQIDVKRSICPAGWKLPTSGNLGSGSGKEMTMTAFVNKDDSFYDLLAQYGYSNAKGYNWNNGRPNTTLIEGTASNNYNGNVAANPLYYARSGYVDLGNGALRGAGGSSYVWSATTYPGIERARELNINTADLSPAYYNAMYYGFSIRCVAK